MTDERLTERKPEIKKELEEHVVVCFILFVESQSVTKNIYIENQVHFFSDTHFVCRTIRWTINHFWKETRRSKALEKNKTKNPIDL